MTSYTYIDTHTEPNYLHTKPNEEMNCVTYPTEI